MEKCHFVENIQLLAFWAIRVEKKYLRPGKKEGEKSRKGRRGSLKVREVVVVGKNERKRKP